MLAKVSALERVAHRQGLVSTWVSSSEHNQIGEEDLRDERAARENQQDVKSEPRDEQQKPETKQRVKSEPIDEDAAVVGGASTKRRNMKLLEDAQKE